jgi:DNA topoisomerase-1
VAPCELCGRPMALKRSRFGVFYGCTGYPECKNIRKIGPAGGAPKETGVGCPECGEGTIQEKNRAAADLLLLAIEVQVRALEQTDRRACRAATTPVDRRTTRRKGPSGAARRAAAPRIKAPRRAEARRPPRPRSREAPDRRPPHPRKAISTGRCRRDLTRLRRSRRSAARRSG